MKTQELRKVIMSVLTGIQGGTYYHLASNDTAFPYKVFDLSSVYLGDLSRDDYSLDIDVFDRATNSKRVDEIADAIEAALSCVNLPQATILPTFFRQMRYVVQEDDKDIYHIQLRFDVQCYERND